MRTWRPTRPYYDLASSTQRRSIPGQRRLPAAPAALRELRAGHRAHRRQRLVAVGAHRRTPRVSLDGLHLAVPGGTPRQLHPRSLFRPQHSTNNGQPMVSIKDVEFDDNGSMIYGLFDGVDVRSEGLVDQFVSTFEQFNLDIEHQFNDSFSVHAYAGRSLSRLGRTDALADLHGCHRHRQLLGGLPRWPRDRPLIGFGSFDVADPEQLPVRARTPGRTPRPCSVASRRRASRGEHHRHQHVRAGRRLADERRVEGEGGCAVPRERFQQPWLEPAAGTPRSRAACRAADASRASRPRSVVSTICSVRARRRAGWPSTQEVA